MPPRPAERSVVRALRQHFAGAVEGGERAVHAAGPPRADPCLSPAPWPAPAAPRPVAEHQPPAAQPLGFSRVATSLWPHRVDSEYAAPAPAAPASRARVERPLVSSSPRIAAGRGRQRARSCRTFSPILRRSGPEKPEKARRSSGSSATKASSLSSTQPARRARARGRPVQQQHGRCRAGRPRPTRRPAAAGTAGERASRGQTLQLGRVQRAGSSSRRQQRAAHEAMDGLGIAIRATQRGRAILLLARHRRAEAERVAARLPCSRPSPRPRRRRSEAQAPAADDDARRTVPSKTGSKLRRPAVPRTSP